MKNQYEVLSSKIIEVLNEAITEGGTTLKDYSNAEEAPGYFKKKLEVYGRGNLAVSYTHLTLPTKA